MKNSLDSTLETVVTHLDILLLFVIVILTASVYFSNYKNHIFFIDEHEFIRKSFYFDLFFVKHDVNDPRWYDARLDEVAQPKVGPYIYGLALHLAGITNIEKSLTLIGFNQRMTGNRRWWDVLWMESPAYFPGWLLPSLEFIWLGRRVAILFTIAAIALIYLACTKAFNVLVGFFAALLFLSNPLLLTEGKFAMTDSMQLFFFYLNLLLVLAWLRLVNSEKLWQTLFLSLAVGTVAALGTGVKVSGILIVPFILTWLFILIWFRLKRQRSVRIILIGGIGALITFCGLFYALHPFLYRDTGNHLRKMFVGRLDEAYRYQQGPFAYTAVRTRKQAFVLIIRRTLLPGGYVNFRILPLDLLLFLTGLILMIRAALNSARLNILDEHAVILIWCAIMYAGLMLYLLDDWGRYYLPLVSCVTIVKAYALATGIQLIGRWIIFPPISTSK